MPFASHRIALRRDTAQYNTKFTLEHIAEKVAPCSQIESHHITPHHINYERTSFRWYVLVVQYRLSISVRVCRYGPRSVTGLRLTANDKQQTQITEKKVASSIDIRREGRVVILTQKY